MRAKHRKKYPKGYILAVILFGIVTFAFLAICNVVYINGRQIYRHGFTEISAANTIRTSVGNISTQLQYLRLTAETKYNTDAMRSKAISDKITEITPKINAEFESLDGAIERLHNIQDLSDGDVLTIAALDTAIKNYKEAALATLETRTNTDSEEEPQLNTPEMQRQKADAIKQKSAENSQKMQESLMNIYKALGEATGKWTGATEGEMAKSRMFHIISDFMMLGIFLAGSTAILLVGASVRRKEERLELKEEEAAKMEQKAEKANQKTVDIAYKNLIMDCGNRYSLHNYLDEAFKGSETFFMSKMMLGDYDAILGMVGFTEMDNYMGTMANRIRDAYGDYGVLFTTAGQDFIFVFDTEVDFQKALAVTDEMRNILSNTQSVFSMAVGSPILGAIANSSNFVVKGSDAMLTSLHMACLNSRATNSLITI